MHILISFEGLIDYVTTEISTSKQKKFSLVTFIDTPGLVDGEMNYPFDVEKTIKFLGNLLLKSINCLWNLNMNAVFFCISYI